MTPTGTRAVLLAGLAAVLLAGCGAPAAVGPPALAPPAPAAAAGLTRGDVDAWLDGLVPAALERSGIAGGVVTVVRDGQILTSRGFGFSDAAARTPVDPAGTLFRVGSVSKTLTATAVMQLVEQGRLDLDADIATYLDFDVPRRFPEPITMRHLLTHTAGFEERLEGLLRLGEAPVDLRETLSTDPPEQVFAPGTTPSYSNYSYGLAGYIAERVSGTPYDELVAQRVLAPAGMAGATFAQPLPPEQADRLSAAYTTVDGPAQPFETVSPAPAGSLAASGDDMGRFMIASMDGTLLGPEATALMREPGIDADTLGTLAEGPRMALGWFDETRNGTQILGHGGDTAFFHSHMHLYPQQRTGVFVSLNSTGRGAVDTLDLRVAITAGFVDRYFPGTGTDTDTAPASPTAAEHAALAAGTYENARAPFSTFLSALNLLGQTTVAANPDGTVTITPAPLSPYPGVYREIRPWVWQEVDGQRLVTMRVASDDVGGDRVEAIAFESAFTLLPTGTARDAALVQPVLVAAGVVLLLALLAWPAGAILRRRYRAPVPSTGRVDRTARLLSRLAAVCAVLALAGWVLVVGTISGLQDVPSGAIRVVQVLQAVALLGAVPAAIALVTALRHRLGAVATGGRALLLLAFVGLAWPVLAFGLLAPSVSY